MINSLSPQNPFLHIRSIHSPHSKVYFLYLFILSFIGIPTPIICQELMLYDCDQGVCFLNIENNSTGIWKADAREAKISPDGQSVLYASRSIQAHFISDIDGRNPRALFLPEFSYNAIWSPEGDRIAVIHRDVPTFTNRLRILDLNGNILDEFNGQPYFNTCCKIPSGLAWSPDGKKIAYHRQVLVPSVGCAECKCTPPLPPCDPGRDTTTIYVIDLESRVGGPLIPAVSVDFNIVATLPIGVTTDAHTIMETFESYSHPVWHPDGSKLALRKRIVHRMISDFRIRGREGSVPQNGPDIVISIGTIPASGGDFTPVISVTDEYVGGDNVFDAWGNRSRYGSLTPLDWSPDGSQIAYDKLSKEEEGTFISSNTGSAQKILSTRIRTLDWANLNLEGVELKIQVTPDQLKVQDLGGALITVTSYEEELRRVSFQSPLIEELFSASPDGILKLSEEDLPEPFELTPENPSESFYVPFIAEGGGLTDLRSSITVSDVAGIEETITRTQDVLVSPLELEISQTPRQLVLNKTEDDQKSEACIELEKSEDVSNCIELTVTVKNISLQRVEGVVMPKAEDVLTMIKSLDFLNPGVPLRVLRFTPPAGTAQQPLPIDLEPVGPGDSATFTWHLEAFDAPATLEFDPVVLGSISGHQVRGFKEEKITILDKVLLKWGISEGRTDFLAGQAVRVEGFIENVSKEEEDEEGKYLLVLVYPIPGGNLGGGFMARANEGTTSDFYEYFVVPPEGDNKRVNLAGVFHSLPLTSLSHGQVEYGVRLWVIEDDDSLTNADDQAQLEDEGNWVDQYSVSFQASDPPPDSYLEDCIQNGHWLWVCGFVDGFVFDFVPAMYGLVQFAGEANMRLLAHKMFLLKTAGDALLGDRAALETFAQTIYDDYVYLANLGVMAGQTVVLSFPEFVEVVVGSLGKFIRAVDEGDLEEVQILLGKFFGSNPDLLLEPFVAARSLTKLGKQLFSTAGEVGENVAQKALLDEAARLERTLPDRIAEARLNQVDPATVMKAGDVLDADVLRSVFGIPKYITRRLQKLCQELDIIVAFRSRHPRATELIDTIPKQAYPKPMALKFKCVNDIDVMYLGYRKDALARIEIVEPPAGLTGKSGPELDAALEAYMDRLKAMHPELRNNDVLAFEVKSRLKTRAEEWDELVPMLDLDPLGGRTTQTKIETNFGYAEQQSAPKRDVAEEVGVVEQRTVIQTPAGAIPDPVAEDSVRRVWEIRMSGAEGDLFVAGDIDFLGIFDRNGRLITDNNKRKAIYAELVQLVDMQHGESYTLRFQKARLKYLRCCVAGVDGSEAMVTIGPGRHQVPTAGYFVDSVSILKGGSNQRFLPPRTKETVENAGKIVFDENGNPKQIEIRRENPNGEFVLINGSAPLSNVALDIVRIYSPFLWKEFISDFYKRIPYYFPVFIAREIVFPILNDNQGVGGGGGLNEEDVEFRLNGPVAQPGRVENGEIIRDSSQLRVWTEAEGWQNATVSEVLEAGDSLILDLAPMTSCPNGAELGDDLIHITTQGELNTSGDFFSVGDRVVLNPGFPNEEFMIITEIREDDEIVFNRSFEFTHESGEMLVCLGPASNNGETQFLRGDCNADTFLDIADAVSNLTYQFLGSFTPTCFDACDFDDSGSLDVSDPIASLSYQFLGTQPPAAPGFQACGIDPTGDLLTCLKFSPCEDG